MAKLDRLEREVYNFDSKLAKYIDTHSNFKAEEWISQKEYLVALGKLVSEIGWTILQEFRNDS